MKFRKSHPSNNRKAQKYRGTQCLNCGQSLDISDVYCPYCSQLNSTKQLSFKDFFLEFFSSLVVYDSRLRNTLKDLLLRPGIITRNYVNGQRLRYANPFRFFLSVSIIYFIVQGFITNYVSPDVGNNINNLYTVDPGDSLKEIFNAPNSYTYNAATKDSIFKILEESQNEKSNDKVSEKMISYFKSINKQKDSVDGDKDVYYSEKELDTMSFAQRNFEKFKIYEKFYKSNKIKNAAVALDSLHHPNTAFNRWIYNKNLAIERIRENPNGFMGYLLGKIPFFLFFFTPFFALFFWLLYSKSKFTYIEHVIFIFHIFSFLFLMMLIVLLPEHFMGIGWLYGILFLIIGPFYFYKALRNFYKEGRLSTILKFVFLNFVFWIGASFAAALFFMVTAAIY